MLQNDVSGKFPRSDVGSLPFMARSSAEGSAALWRLYRSGLLDAEYDSIHPLMLVAMTPSGIHLAHPLKSLDNLGGAKLIVADPRKIDLVKKFATNVPRTGWLPEPLRTPRYDGPGAQVSRKPKKPAKPVKKGKR